MTKAEIKGLITLSIKSKKKNSILLKFNLMRFCRLRGKIVSGHNFLYSINFKKFIIPIHRIWNSLLKEVNGYTEKDYLDSLNKQIEKYNYPRYCLFQAYYLNPETNQLKEFPMSDEEKEKYYNIREEDI